MQESPLILIYYNFKGHTQIARHLLCYLDLPFYDIHIDCYQQQKLHLPPNIISILQGQRIIKQQLPLLIHEGLFIYTLYPINAYLCNRFNRQDLLGSNIYQKAIVQQMTEIHTNRIAPVKDLLFTFSDIAMEKHEDGLQLMPFIEKGFYRLIQKSGYMYQFSIFLMRQPQQKYILANLTLLDFYYIEASRYMLGLFGSLDQHCANQKWKEVSKAYTKIKQQRGQLIYFTDSLRAMKKFQLFIYSHPYYIKYKQYLQSYKVVGCQMSDHRKNGVRKVWADNLIEVY